MTNDVTTTDWEFPVYIPSATKTGIHLQLKLKRFHTCFPLRRQKSCLKTIEVNKAFKR